MDLKEVEDKLWKTARSKRKDARYEFSGLLIDFAIEVVRVGLAKRIKVGGEQLQADYGTEMVQGVECLVVPVEELG